MRIWSLIAAAMFVVPAFAQNIDCRNAMTQRDINRCAGMEYQAADMALNDSYNRLLALRNGDSAKLRAAQRAWIAFRDAECTSRTAESEGGSIHPMEYSACLTSLTKARTRQLRDSLACYRNAEQC